MGVREGGGHAFTTHKVPSTSLHDQTFCIEQGATDHVGLRVLRILMIRNAYKDLIIVQSNTLQRSLQAFLLDAESLIVEQSGGIEDGACMPVLSLHFAMYEQRVHKLQGMEANMVQLQAMPFV